VDGLQFRDFTQIPFPLNLRAPHLPYIVRRRGDPTLPSDTEIRTMTSKEMYLDQEYLASLLAFADRSRTRFWNWKRVVEPLKLPGWDICPTPPLGTPGSPKAVLNGSFPSRGRVHEICSDVLRASYEYGGLARLFMHRYVDHIAQQSKSQPPPCYGVDNDMIGAVFRFPLPRSLVAIQAALSGLESHGVPIFGVEELVDRVRYDAYGPEQSRAAVAGMSNPAAVSNPHRVSIEMMPHHAVIRPPVWRMKSDDEFPKRRDPRHYVDEDAYSWIVKGRPDELRFKFSEVFGRTSLGPPDLEPSNYFQTPPPPTPPPPPTESPSASEINNGFDDGKNYPRTREELIQELDESDEAFEARKRKAAAKKAKVAAQRNAAAEYINKAREGDLGVYHDIRKRIRQDHEQKKPFDVLLASMWRKVYTKEAHEAAQNIGRKGKEKSGHDKSLHEHKEDDVRMRAEEDPRREAEIRRLEEDNARMQQETHQRAEDDARQRAEDDARQRAEDDARQQAEENRQADEKDAPSGAELTVQNATDVGDDKTDHNDDPANKAADDLAKMIVDDHPKTPPSIESQSPYHSPPFPPAYSPATIITPPSLPLQSKSQSLHRAASPPDVVSPPPSPQHSLIDVSKFKLHTISPSHQRSSPPSHQASTPSHELSPLHPRVRSHSLTPSPRTETQGGSVALSSNLPRSPPELKSGMQYHQRSSSTRRSHPSERFERGPHVLPTRSRPRSRSRDLPPLPPRSRPRSRSRDPPPRSRDPPPRSPPRSRDLPPHSHDFLSRSRDLPPHSHDLPHQSRNLQWDRTNPATSQSSQSRQTPTAPRAFRMRSEVDVSNDWRTRTVVGPSRAPSSGVVGPRDMLGITLEGASPSKFDGSSRGRQQGGLDGRAHQRPPAPVSSNLGASHCE